MNKQEFINRSNAIEARINELRKEQEALDAEYVNTNQPYQIGQKVKVSYPTSDGGKEFFAYGFVTGYELIYHDVLPVLAKMKVDGTEHKTAHLSLSWWRNPIIEMVND